jgi:hypothetical protein
LDVISSRSNGQMGVLRFAGVDSRRLGVAKAIFL